MGVKRYKPYTPSRRQMTVSDFAEITKKTPEKSLVVHLKKELRAQRTGQNYGASQRWRLKNKVPSC